MSLNNSAKSLGYDINSRILTLYNQKGNALSTINLYTGTSSVGGQSQGGFSLRNGVGYAMALNGNNLYLLNSQNQYISNC